MANSDDGMGVELQNKRHELMPYQGLCCVGMRQGVPAFGYFSEVIAVFAAAAAAAAPSAAIVMRVRKIPESMTSKAGSRIVDARLCTKTAGKHCMQALDSGTVEKSDSTRGCYEKMSGRKT